MIVVASGNGRVGMGAAWAVLCDGGSALDAVEAGTRVVEDDPTDHTVGYGGYPNYLGQVELDASIMEGTTRRVGAVGALRRTRRAVSLARRVMEDLPHALVVGEGADRLAAECGFDAEDLLTDEARRAWEQWVGSAAAAAAGQPLRELVAVATDPERVAGTVNFLAQDGEGRIAAAVSTSGWAWKYPGRLGDTPVIGAGNYADDRYGAAACTGFGELAIRTGAARTVVAGMQAGLSPDDACRAAIDELFLLGLPPEKVVMNVVALSADGRAAAASTMPDRTYVVQSDGMAAHAELPRTHVSRQ